MFDKIPNEIESHQFSPKPIKIYITPVRPKTLQLNLKIHPINIRIAALAIKKHHLKPKLNY